MLTKKQILFWLAFGLVTGVIDMFFDWDGEFTMGIMIGAGVMALYLTWVIGQRELDKQS